MNNTQMNEKWLHKEELAAMKIFDISRPLNNETPTWPGDTPFSYKVNWSKEETGSVNVGSLEMSVHTATHVDAPFHFDSNRERIADLDLSVFLGPAFVLDVSSLQEITKEHIEKIIIRHPAKRILFRTDAWKDETVFPSMIPTMSMEAVKLLEVLEVPLIGVDLPSVDQLDSKSLDIHHALYKANIAILEGVDLRGIEEGEYQLAALPLKVSEADGSPVRAVLIQN
jgi:arylformamidase